MREKVGYAAFAVVLIVRAGASGSSGSGRPQLLRGQGLRASRQAPSASPSATAARPHAVTSPTPIRLSRSRGHAGTVCAARSRRARSSFSSTTVPTDQPGPRTPPVHHARHDAVVGPVAQFTMATFNLLGSSHTRHSGKDSPARPRARPAPARCPADPRTSTRSRVVGLQEFQTDQRAAFQSRATGLGDVPRPVHARRRRRELRRLADLRLGAGQAGHRHDPYFHGSDPPDAVVLLRNKQTGVQAYFSNFHNPADTAVYCNGAASRGDQPGDQAVQGELEATGMPAVRDRRHERCATSTSAGSPAPPT